LTQRESFVIRTRRAQKFANFFHLTFGLGNCSQRRARAKFAGLNALQQTTLKRPATFRTPGVNPAQLSIKTGARLCESLLTACFLQRQPQFSQPLDIIALSQFHVGKQNAVAAQPAIRAKLRNSISRRIFNRCALFAFHPLSPPNGERDGARGSFTSHIKYRLHRHRCFGYFRCNSDLMRG
jgi:hypothetical protein